MALSDDERYMQMALREAELAYNEDEIPVGAVVVCNGMVIARAHNLTEMLNDVTAHAEMQAITSATNQLGGKYLNKCTMYVTLEPCIMCAGAIGWSQMGRLVWGVDDLKRGFSRFAPDALHPKTEISKGVMAEKCAEIIQEFFKNKR